MKKTFWIFISGAIWFAVGAMLLYKGIHLIAAAPLAEQTATWFMMVGLAIGFVKGRFVLSKTVARVVGRIQSLQEPIRISTVYAPAYWLLIGFMFLLGFSFKFLPIPLEYRGLVDVAIGSALINGAMLYWRAIYGIGNPSQSQERDKAAPKE